MDVYSVVSRQVLRYFANDTYYRNLPFNFLFKFENKSYNLLENYPNINIRIDSGAYYFNSRLTSEDDEATLNFIWDYMDFIEETCDDPRVTGYFDMDLMYINLRSMKHLRRKLFRLTDKIIPVFHGEWGEHEFKKMCSKYNYIGLPNYDDYNIEEFMPFVKYAHKKGCKIHCLGMDRDKIMRNVPFNSVDSAIWIRQGYMEYYANHNIEKNSVNNDKFQSRYVKRELIKQWQRQTYYHELWENYHNHQQYKTNR